MIEFAALHERWLARDRREWGRTARLAYLIAKGGGLKPKGGGDYTQADFDPYDAAKPKPVPDWRAQKADLMRIAKKKKH